MIKNYESKNKNISPISLQFFGYVLADNKYIFVIHSRTSLKLRLKPRPRVILTIAAIQI